MVNVVWFRNDLRIADNPALFGATTNNQLIRAVFFVTEQQWQKHDWGTNKIGFVLRNILCLQQELLKINVSLDIIDSKIFNDIPLQLLTYLKQHKSNKLFFNKEYELNECIRDQKVIQLLANNNINCYTFYDQSILEPQKILNKNGTPYKVFTAYKKAWIDLTLIKGISLNNKFVISNNQCNWSNSSPKQLPKYYTKYLTNDIQSLWPAGEIAASKRLKIFCNANIYNYHKYRDLPTLEYTSKLSPYLAVGAISLKQCLVAALNKNKLLFIKGDSGITTWINELIWREFYKYITYHFPKISKHENFNNKYNYIKWKKSEYNLKCWQKGKTGLPIIDAAMRQLHQTGWMHNRLRMVVAMFLTKNLLIDWREGEKFFANHLIDLDFAANNGGWQWSASTGVDAVPYFRIFNPVTQSKRFDPDGKFIKKYCPELKELPITDLHNPSLKLSIKQLNDLGYCKLIIDLNQSRREAILAFTSPQSAHY